MVAFLSYTYNSVSFTIIMAYLLMVALSKTWKQYTKPVQLSKWMTAYNYAMAAANAVCLGLFVWTLLACDRFYSKARDPRVVVASRLYWLLKIAELLDTVFMVVRHKARQISVLHVYHHASMVLLTDYFHHLAPWPAISFPVMVNSAVHVCLYAYYGLTSSGVAVPIHWKRGMTQIQLVQFGIGLVHSTVGYLHHGFCVFSILYAVSMVLLFGNFYMQAYGAERKARRAL